MQLEFIHSGRRLSIVRIMQEKNTNKIIVGVSPRCDLKLALLFRQYKNYLRYVTTKHFAIHREDLFFLIEDLESRNGTEVNNEPLSANQKRRLREGDIIKLAKMPELTIKVLESNEPLGLYYNEVREYFVVEDHPIATLTPLESGLMEFLYDKAGTKLSFDEIAYSEIWKNIPDDNQIYRTIRNIHRKLDEACESKGIGMHYIQRVDDGYMLTRKRRSTSSRDLFFRGMQKDHAYNSYAIKFSHKRT